MKFLVGALFTVSTTTIPYVLFNHLHIKFFIYVGLKSYIERPSNCLIGFQFIYNNNYIAVDTNESLSRKSTI